MKQSIRLNENRVRKVVKKILNEITSDERAQLEDDFNNEEGEYRRITREGFRLFKELESKYEPTILKYLASCINLQYGKHDPFNL